MSSGLTWRTLRDVNALVATAIGIGLVPKAPGTVASIFAVVVWWFWLSGYNGFAQIAIILLVGGLAFYCVHRTMRKYRVADDPAITIDEVLGQWVALIALPKSWWVVLIAFVGFRLLDILKPDPVGWIDEKLKGAGGVIADDLVAGVLVVAVLHAALFWFRLGI